MTKQAKTDAEDQKSGASEPSDKEKRLADALRANLRRRKAPPKKPDPST